MKIRAYLALMVAAILVPVILFSALSLNMLLRSQREAALKGVRETARMALVSIDRELTNTESAIRMLATSPSLAQGDLAAFYQQARFADKAGATWTALLDEHGQQLINTSLAFGAGLPGPDTAAARVAQVLAAGTPQISNLIRGANTQALMVAVDVPVTTTSGLKYVIAQGFRIDHFNDVLRKVDAPPTWLAGVFDRNGMTIAQMRGGAQRGEVQPDLRDAIRDGKVGVIRNASADNLKLYTVLERSALSGWTVAVGVPETEIELAARSALMIAMLGLIAAIVCATGAAVFFARRLSQSIGQAAQSAHLLEHGQVVGPSQVSGVHEVDEVHSAIAAAATVVGSEKQSRQLAEAERAVLFERERAARTMAERQNQAKDEFLAMLGHELRNPLAAIVNAASVMAHPGLSGEALERSRTIVARQSGHLTRIVDDLLDMGRVHSGKILLERQTLRLDQLAAGYVATLAHSERAAQHALGHTGEEAWVDADPTRIEQILANLIDNALKYTPPGGKIDVAVEADCDEVVLSVTDTGIGMEPELMPHVFDLFVQGARTLERAQGGLGLGLALVQRMAQMHGGRVTVESDGAGQGSRFEVRLPRIKAPAPHEAMPLDDDAQAAPALQAPAPAHSGQRVLLIEDNEDGREMMAMMLEAQQYQVACAVDGYEGLRMALASQPDVALVDIGLPGIDGYEVARRMRSDPITSTVRLIALTGYGQESDRARALDAGFDAHLVKPVDLQQLMELLETT